MADQRIEIEIVLDDGSIATGFQSVEKKGKETGNKLERAFSRVGSRIVALGATVAAAFAGRKVIAAASRQQDAINTLNNSLRAAGSFSEAASQDFQKFASELQKVSTVGDEVTLELGALARNFTQTNAQAKQLTKAAIELSAATGISLESAVKNLGKTFGGLTGELGESVPALRNLTKEQLKAGEAVDFVLERFGGSAAAQVNTFSGAITQLGNIFGDLLEEIGFLIIESPKVVAAINFISQQFKSASDATKEFGASRDVIGELLQSLILFAEGVNTFLVVPIELAVNGVKIAFNGILTTIQGVIFGIASAAAKFANFFAPNSEAAKKLNKFVESSGEVFNDFANQTEESTNRLFDFDISAKSADFLQKLKMTVDEATSITEEGIQVANENLQKTAENTRQIGGVVGKALLSALTQGVAAIGGALVKGENAFQAFGKVVLGVIGDLAIQIGSTLLSIGLGIDSLKLSLNTLTGGFAIAAGLALIALGGALKALSGGAGGLGVSAGGGAATAPTTPAFTADTELDAEEDIEGPQTGVTINVEGTVIDPKTTGENIATALQEFFDASGGQLVVNA